MTSEEIDFTKAWWVNVTNDTTKFSKWLQKLQVTEISGYQEHVDYLSNHTVSKRSALILMNVAEDELKHSNILLELMADRKIEPVLEKNKEVTSSYWDTMNSTVLSFEDYCAVNHFGEGLAAARFEIILGHENTPHDIKEALRMILPDEVFHRETLLRLSSEESLAAAAAHHRRALNALMRK